MTVQNHNQAVANERPAVDVQNPVTGSVTARRLYDGPEWDQDNRCEDCGRPTHHGYGACYPQLVDLNCKERQADGWNMWPVGTQVMILSRFTRQPGYTGIVVGYGAFQTGAIGTLVQIREGEPPLLVNNSLLVQ